MTKENVVPEAQHSKRAYSQLFLKKIRHLLLKNYHAVSMINSHNYHAVGMIN